MSLARQLDRHWLLPTCGPNCRPGDHDPRHHEAMGLLMGMLTPPATEIMTGPLYINLRTREVRVAGEPVYLSSREFHLLRVLAERIGYPCMNDDLVVEVWGPEYLTHQLKNCPDGVKRRSDLRVLRTRINTLRKKLGEKARGLIQSSPSGSQAGWYQLMIVEPEDA